MDKKGFEGLEIETVWLVLNLVVLLASCLGLWRAWLLSF